MYLSYLQNVFVVIGEPIILILWPTHNTCYEHSVSYHTLQIALMMINITMDSMQCAHRTWSDRHLHLLFLRSGILLRCWTSLFLDLEIIPQIALGLDPECRDGRPALRGPAPRKTGCPAPLRKTPLLPRPDPPRRSGQNWLNKKMKQISQYKIISVIFEVVCFFRFGVKFLFTLCFSICIFKSRDPLQE